MALTDSVEYRDPFGVTYDDETDHVRVMVVIPNLKKAFMKNEPTGGKVDLKFGERSFDLKLSHVSKETGNKKAHHYRYSIKQLPAPILASKCDYKVKDGKVILRLFKAKNDSWQAQLTDTGLETCEDEDN